MIPSEVQGPEAYDCPDKPWLIYIYVKDTGA